MIDSPAIPRLLVLSFLGLCLQGLRATGADAIPDRARPEATRPDEPLAKQLSFQKSAEYLDGVTVHWWKSNGCASCHTSYPFLMARPLLGDADAPVYQWMRQTLEKRVAGWDNGKEGGGLPEEEDEAVTEIMATAATLAFDDARIGKLSPPARKALDRMWTIQRKDGSWNWNKHNLPPQELDEYFGVVYATLGVAYAPGEYAKEASAKEGLDRIRAYLRQNPSPNLHHKIWLLWASFRLDGLMSKKMQQETIREILDLQLKDGGWNLPSLGNWKRLNGNPNPVDGPADGYATGLIVYVLRQSAMPADREPIKKAIHWLKTNQRASGRWYTRSLNSDRAHYTTNAGTAFAVMALKACDVSDQ